MSGMFQGRKQQMAMALKGAQQQPIAAQAPLTPATPATMDPSMVSRQAQELRKRRTMPTIAGGFGGGFGTQKLGG